MRISISIRGCVCLPLAGWKISTTLLTKITSSDNRNTSNNHIINPPWIFTTKSATDIFTIAHQCDSLVISDFHSFIISRPIILLRSRQITIGDTSTVRVELVILFFDLISDIRNFGRGVRCRTELARRLPGKRDLPLVFRMLQIH